MTWEKGHEGLETETQTPNETKKAHEMLTCLLAREYLYALNASKAGALRCTDTHRQLYLADQEGAAGMIRSSH